MRFRTPAVLATAAMMALAGGPLAGRAHAAAAGSGAGFDTCGAPPLATMSAWLGSPYRTMGIYIGGINRACADGNLSQGWIGAAQSQGWQLIPTYVGRQAPCVGQPGLTTIDPAAAAAQGAADADDAAARAAGFGLGANTPIYFDMEAYGSDTTCTQAVRQFLTSWTVQLHRRGYVSGVYGSSASTIADEARIAGNCSYVLPDAIWFANWNGSGNTFGDRFFSDGLWANHRRIHQYAGGHTETYGPNPGVALNIDSDVIDGPVAGGPDVVRLVAGITGSPAIASPTSGPYAGAGSAYLRGTDGALYTTWQVHPGECWQAWQQIGGPGPGGGIQGSPTVVVSTVGQYVNTLSNYAAGTDGALYTTWQGSVGGGWYPWTRIGGAAPVGGIQGPPTVVMAVSGPMAGTLSAYARAGGGALYTTWQSTPGGLWQPWTRIGGAAPGGIQGPPAVVLSTIGPMAGTLSAYARSGDGTLYTTWQSSVGSLWQPWTRIGGTAPGGIQGPPAVVLETVGPYTGTLSAYARGGDGTMYTTWQNTVGGLWHAWQQIAGGPPGGGIQVSPAVLQATAGPATGTLSAYARGGDGTLYTAWQTSVGGLWHAWQQIAGTPPPGAITDLPVPIESSVQGFAGIQSVYARGADGALYTTFQSTVGGLWSGWQPIGWTMPAV